ncbi:MAG: tetratricopeptide repeat protein, partial [Chloroflexota bacterium]
VHRRQRRPAEAEALLLEVIALRPDWALPRANLANLLHDAGQYEAALASYDEALRLDPGAAVALASWANTLAAVGRFEEAEQACLRAIALEPRLVLAHSNLGNALSGQGRFDDAIRSFEQALVLDPSYAEALSSMASTYKEQERWADAEACCQRALALRPDFPEAYANLGIILQFQEKLDDAQRCFERAVELRPDYAEAYSHIATNYYVRGDSAAALEYFEKALALRPDYPEARFNRSLVSLREGDWEQGWVEYEWRWKTVALRGKRFASEERLWDGSRLPRGTLLLQAEQGLGDTLQFSRYVPLAAQRVGAVVLAVPQELVSLCRASFPEVTVQATWQPLPAWDVYAPLLTLPRLFHTRPDTVPAQSPYLRVDALQAATWAQRLPASPELKVGLAWKAQHEKARTVPPAQLAQLAGVPGVAYYALQKRAYNEPWPFGDLPIEVQDLNSWLWDFSETAAALQRLDLLVSADTSVPHLAGALRRPVWLLLPHVPEWRWGLHGSESPWYPTAHLFRQPRPGEWAAVIAEVREALCEVAADPQRFRSTNAEGRAPLSR